MLTPRCARILFCLFIFIASALRAVDFTDTLPPETLAREIVAAMSDEDALAQTFMFGWRDSGDAPLPLIQRWISQRHIGGVKVFGWNTQNVSALARNIGNFQKQALSSGLAIPLFVATDQEGGFVRHVKDTTSITPGAMAIGASGFPEDAYLSGYYIGRELALIGINMNFAPAVDLYTNHKSLLISSRSFGDDPAKVGIMAAAFAKGQLAAGVVPTAKHFPGHGDTALDSHGVLPRIDADFGTLWDRELIPYRMLSKEDIPAIMSGHIAFPNTEAKMTPASLSPYFLTDVLRGEIGYRGLIVTDDLSMNGATSSTGWRLWLAAKDALLAGNDIIMISNTPEFGDPIWVNLIDAMKKEAAFRARVRDAAERVVLAKLQFLRGAQAVPYVPDLNKVKTDIPDKEGAVFFQNLAARSVTIVREKPGTFPLGPEKAGRTLLAGGGTGEKQTHFFDVGRMAYGPKTPRFWYSKPVLDLFVDYARDFDTIIFYLEKEEGLEILRAIRPLGKRVIVLSVLSPAYLAEATWVDGSVAVYSDSRESLVAGFSAIIGRFDTHGELPFKMR